MKKYLHTKKTVCKTTGEEKAFTYLNVFKEKKL